MSIKLIEEVQTYSKQLSSSNNKSVAKLATDTSEKATQLKEITDNPSVEKYNTLVSTVATKMVNQELDNMINTSIGKIAQKYGCTIKTLDLNNPKLVSEIKTTIRSHKYAFFDNDEVVQQATKQVKSSIDKIIKES